MYISHSSPIERDPFIGYQINGLRFDRLIGRGAMGAVYQCIQVHLDRQVAVKVIAQNLANDQRYIERFSREAKAIGGLHHPNIITCYDFLPCTGPLQENIFLLVMEYVDGPSLSQWLTEKRSVRDLLAIFAEVADGLAAAHRAGFLHRDIKPDNIMTTVSGHGKLADFGLARKTVETIHVTQAGELLGTPAFMSPEACRGAEIGTTSDIYSLGCALFQALCGRLPYPASGSLQALQRHIHDRIPLIATLRPDLAVCDPLLQRCLAKDPHQRPQSAEVLAQELRKLYVRVSATTFCGGATGSTEATVLETEPESLSLTKLRIRKRSARFILISVVSGALVCVGFFIALHARSEPQRLAPTFPTNLGRETLSLGATIHPFPYGSPPSKVQEIRVIPSVSETSIHPQGVTDSLEPSPLSASQKKSSIEDFTVPIETSEPLTSADIQTPSSTVLPNEIHQPEGTEVPEHRDSVPISQIIAEPPSSSLAKVPPQEIPLPSGKIFVKSEISGGPLAEPSSSSSREPEMVHPNHPAADHFHQSTQRHRPGSLRHDDD